MGFSGRNPSHSVKLPSSVLGTHVSIKDRNERLRSLTVFSSAMMRARPPLRVRSKQILVNSITGCKLNPQEATDCSATKDLIHERERRRSEQSLLVLYSGP